METTTSNLLTTLGTVLESVWDWFGDVIDLAGDQPIMLIPAGIGVAGALIGLFKRTVKVGGRRR